MYEHLEVTGKYLGKEGTFEAIKDTNAIITHWFFRRSRVTVNSIPSRDDRYKQFVEGKGARFDGLWALTKADALAALDLIADALIFVYGVDAINFGHTDFPDYRIGDWYQSDGPPSGGEGLEAYSERSKREARQFIANHVDPPNDSIRYIISASDLNGLRDIEERQRKRLEGFRSLRPGDPEDEG